MEKKILDVTCGARSIWFNKHHPAAVYCDKRREQVEMVWMGKWIGSADGYADGELVYDTWICSECGHVIDEEDDPDMLPQFCPKCYAAMTDEAVDIVMRRLEALKDGL